MISVGCVVSVGIAETHKTGAQGEGCSSGGRGGCNRNRGIFLLLSFFYRRVVVLVVVVLLLLLLLSWDLQCCCCCWRLLFSEAGSLISTPNEGNVGTAIALLTTLRTAVCSAKKRNVVQRLPTGIRRRGF